MKINKKWYEDKVQACWIGKNIGGTIGGPFEGVEEMVEVTGFTTEKGQPLPNDDLDLQLLWLKAIEERGILGITPAVLGEYWVRFIPPQWNEYGIAKANLKMGLLPPFCGEFENDHWKHSNGAWIRTEIWACLFPGFPEMAVKYAYKDACIDHGLGEGTTAAIFVAALQSAAFVESDFRKLMDIGFSFISKDSMTAKSIRLAIDCYDNGVDFKEARNKIVDFSRDLGMFQAPANVAFVVLGLLYGEGDFKKSILLATSCGDDTDCTAATVGSTMALMGGMKAIPEDWAEYVGDKILSYAIDLSMKRLCRSCSELTQRIVKQLPGVLGNFDVQVEFTDGETEYTEEKPVAIIPQFSIPTNPYTYDDLADLTHTKLRAEFDRAPVVKPGETIKLTVTFLNGMYDPRNLFLKLHLPEGWSAEYKKHIAIMHDSTGHRWIDEQPWDAVITVGENTETINKLFLEVSAEGNPRTGMVPIIILG